MVSTIGKPLEGEAVTFQLASGTASADVDAWESERVEFERAKYLALIQQIEDDLIE